MYRATTPTLIFTLDKWDITEFDLQVTIYQEPGIKIIKQIKAGNIKGQGIKINKEKNQVIIDLTEDEINQFHYGEAFAQLRARTQGTTESPRKIMASRVFCFDIQLILEDEWGE